MSLKLISFAILISLSNEAIVSEEKSIKIEEHFCNSFAKNYFEVDYVYQHNSGYLYLFIGHNYWWIQQNTKQLNPLNNENAMNQSIDNWFGNQFQTAFDVAINGQFLTGLLKKSGSDESHDIEWAIIEKSEHNFLKKSNDFPKNMKRNSKIHFENGFNPLIAKIGGNTAKDTVYFIDQKPNAIEYQRSFRSFRFRLVDDVITAEDSTNDLKSKLGPLTNLRGLKKIVGSAHLDKYLFKEGKAITWCNSFKIKLGEECNKTTTLISCSHMADPSTTIPVITESDKEPIKESKNSSFVVIGISSLVVLALIFNTFFSH